MKKYLSLVLVLCIGILYNTCKDEDNSSSDDELAPEILSDSEVEFWDNQTSVELTSDEVILPNGLSIDEFLLEMDPDFYNEWTNKRSVLSDDIGPQDSKNLLIAKLNLIAIYLTTRSNFQYEGNELGQPPQNGLAYSYGSKNHTIRQKPSEGDCDEEVYGLDCSGLIYQLFSQCKISGLWTTAEKQRQPEVLETAIKNAYEELDKIKVEDLGSIAPDEFESGDIIYWLRNNGVAKHIGMVLKNSNGTLLIAQSNGSGKAEECTDNYGPKRGPRFVSTTQAIEPVTNNGFGDNYGIVRINAEISGKWDITLKCQGADFTFLTLSLDFPTTSSNNFTIDQSAVYQSDNVTYDLSFQFTYDNVSNVLSCTFKTTASVYPDFYRYDSFSIKLERDDTDYFPADLGLHMNSGCLYDVRLVNNETSSVKESLMKDIHSFTK